MQSTTMLQLLRIFLIVAGVVGALWGIYDMFGDGQQSSMGVKKLIGGIAFAVIAGFVMTMAINQVKAAESQAGITGSIYLPFIINSVSNLIR